MARLYHRDQPGAPALVYSNTLGGLAHFDAFKTILKACLVSGYGEVPAAGWELIFESVRALVLRNGSKSGYVCFQSDATTPALLTVWLAATYTGVDAAGKIMGDGVRSGVAASSGVPQRFSLRNLVGSTQASTWSVVGDGKTFIFSPSGGNGATASEVTSATGQPAEAITPLYCGEDMAGDFVAIGGLNTASTSSSPTLSSFGSNAFTALKFPDTGLLIDNQAISVAMPLLDVAISSNFYSALLEGVSFPSAYLCRFSWVARGRMRNLRGVVNDPRLGFVYPSTLSQALGGPALTTRTISTPLNLGDGQGYVVARTHHLGSQSLILTTNPEFW